MNLPQNLSQLIIRAVTATAFLDGAVVLCQPSPQWGVNDPSHADLNILNSEGKVFSVKMDLDNMDMDKKSGIRFVVVGKDVVDLKEMKLVARQLQPGPPKTLALSQNGNEFELTSPIDFPPNQTDPAELELTTQTTKESEVHHFKIYPGPKRTLINRTLTNGTLN